MAKRLVLQKKKCQLENRILISLGIILSNLSNSVGGYIEIRNLDEKSVIVTLEMRPSDVFVHFL
jgi:hypothetical protein